MSGTPIGNEKHARRIFLGIDGGQSHTEALIADESGNILGRGIGGPSNHADQPGGRERLKNAVEKSVSEALTNCGLPPLSEMVFDSIHCGMTGGADYKAEIIGTILKGNALSVGHDAPTALLGATAGKPGVVVIAGTGSIVYGMNERGETARFGGLGYLFSDEGSGFWLAAQAIRLAIKEQDNSFEPAGLERLVLSFFGYGQIRELTDDFYNDRVSRDQIAAFAKTVHQAAEGGNETLRAEIKSGVGVLTEGVVCVAKKLGFAGNFPVAGAGGMFKANLTNIYFRDLLNEKIDDADFITPRFSPAVGSLLVAYQQIGISISDGLLTNLEYSSQQND